MANLTPKQEAFAFAYVETGNASEAYRRAYDVSPDCKPETVWNDAYKLRCNPEVAARVKALQDELNSEGMVTLQSVTQDLKHAHRISEELNQPHNMIKATTEIAKLHGLTADKLEITGKDGGAIETKDQSANDLARKIAFAMAKGLKE